MRKRNHEIKLRLDDKEYERLNDMVSRTRYSRETFLRMLLEGYQLKDTPQDFYEFRRDLLHIINALRPFSWNRSLSSEEKSNLLSIIDEVVEVSRRLNKVHDNV